ncbi:MAG: hypothetical protein O7H40_05280 [Gammaproteobacteria bacterium]|nr:hypothetical protein [Gammaproteobacteria bacterium]
MQPKPMADTSGPFVPTRRFFIAPCLFLLLAAIPAAGELSKSIETDTIPEHIRYSHYKLSCSFPAM